MDPNLQRVSNYMTGLSLFYAEASEEEVFSPEKSECEITDGRHDFVEELMQQATRLLMVKQSLTAQTKNLSRSIGNHLLAKGVLFRKIPASEEAEAKENYNRVLQRLYDVNEQNKNLEKKIIEEQSVVLTKKNINVEKVKALKKGET